MDFKGRDEMSRNTYIRLYKEGVEEPFAHVYYRFNQIHYEPSGCKKGGSSPIIGIIDASVKNMLFKISNGKLSHGDPKKYKTLVKHLKGSKIRKKYPHVWGELTNVFKTLPSK